ncbi:TIM barrel protein [Marmoricola sp. URHB0036]|uniref:TIM barrel protein n=1 Tax=Marmoricola sp. URHB0036 TaxID=1298863 RepID=UPI0003FAF053|nr:TIM barrel protein [Marmoricola sp. URHB0036]
MTELISGAATPGHPIQGVTLYSFTRAFHGRRYDLEGLIRKVAADGLGPGLEIIGFSSFRGFPDLDDEFVDWFRALVEETGLVLTSCAVNTDVGIRRDRLLTDDELIAYMERQITTAARLGFPLARVQISLSPDAMERLLPLAERLDIVLAIEIHAHHHPHHPQVVSLRERYETLGSPLLGFVADWGTTTSGLAPSMVEAYRRRGASAELLEAADQLWKQYYAEGPPPTEPAHGERFGAFIGLAAQHGSPELGIDLAINATGLFGPAPVESWLEILPWVRHVHGKFFGIDERGEEPSVPVRALVAQLVEEGYDGAISSEYEGWHWNYWDDAFDIVTAEQAVQRDAAVNAGSAMVLDADQAREQLRAHLASLRVPG